MKLPNLKQPHYSLHGTRWQRLLIAVIFLATIYSTRFPFHIFHQSTISPKPHQGPLRHLLIPASQPDPNLCKTILSSTLLHYPIPTIINWGQTFNNQSLANGGSHIAKLQGLYSHLAALGPDKDDELVLVVDGYDVWFQLDAQLLVERYHAVNARADARLTQEIGAENMRNLSAQQSVVFSSQKRCWPGSPADTQCYAVPPSPLPTDLYGADTDQDIDDGSERYLYARYRPRYLNSGVVMGNVGAMRSMFERAVAVQREGEKEGEIVESDQGVFSLIWGMQEFQRRVIGEQWEMEKEEEGLGGWREWKGRFVGKEGVESEMMGAPTGVLGKHPTHKKPRLWDDMNYEFGIGLDYWSELGQATVFANHDMEWVRFADKERLQESWERKNVSNPGGEELADDIKARLRPFAILNEGVGLVNYTEEQSKEGGRKEPGGGKVWIAGGKKMKEVTPQTAGWDDVKLFTNLWTGVTPVMIHHNAHHGGLKQNRESMWGAIWFQRSARVLLRKILQQGKMEGEERIAKEYGQKNLVLKTDKKGTPWVGWNDLCDAEMQEEVFRDGKGVEKFRGD
ncbi:uncharacterized protein KY384_003355 [Bacidia gigantensis]|uniref:uncharacterized protein n=1 Tax=Bacidia gigantensis TaxID=2732470 RepID=UPI001D05B4A0|nr:uncharacterized protein KY384_003355 [Bacidia gigantensis]KAG8531723.1 hypothetical protein KY384_003355 [Bacidia gigantensis]